MKYPLVNGWTQASILAALDKYVPDTRDGCRDEVGGCAYIHDEHSCGIGALLRAREDPQLDELSGSITTLVEDSGDAYCLMQDLPFEDLEALQLLQNVHDNDAGGMTALQRCIDWVRSHTDPG
jgi:hypothetical protein